jgi:hypothetical protein
LLIAFGVAGCASSEPRSARVRMTLTGGNTYTTTVSNNALRFELPVEIENADRQAVFVDDSCYWLLERWTGSKWEYSAYADCPSSPIGYPTRFIDRLAVAPRHALQFNLSAFVNLDGSNSVGAIPLPIGDQLRLLLLVRPEGKRAGGFNEGFYRILSQPFTLTVAP